MDPLPGVNLAWTESAEPLANFQRYMVYRRELGATAWELRKRITDRSLTSFQDNEVESGKLYEYDVTQVSDASGTEIESLHTTGVQASATFESLWLHDRNAPGYYAQLFIASQRIAGPRQDIAYLQPWSASVPTAHVGNMLARTYSATLRGQWNHSQGRLSAEQYRALVTLIERQKTGSVLVARQPLDVLLYCVIDSDGLERSDEAGNFSESLRLREVRSELEVN